MEILNKPDWQVTATTVYCDAVDDEVTLMVYADGTTKCTGLDKYTKPDKETARMMKKKNRKRKLTGCSGNNCLKVKQYRDSLIKS